MTLPHPRGFNRITLYFDSKASRKGDRVWKLVVPRSADVVEHVRIPVPVPTGHVTDDGGGLADAFDAALEAATVALRELGVEPDWRVREHALEGTRLATTEVPHAEAQ